MMSPRFFLLIFAALASPAFAQRQSIGVFYQWGGFEEKNPRKCFAIAEPERGPKAEGWKPFASIGYWPERNVRGQLHFRLSRTKRQGSAVLLKIDDRVWQLSGGGNNAWAPDARTDAEIVAAIRSGMDMIVETRSERGALVRDYYRLRGAASAIDAAAVACARRS